MGMPIALGTAFAVTLLGLPGIAMVYPAHVGDGNDPIVTRAGWVIGWMFAAAMLCGLYAICAVIADATERKRAS